MTTGPEDHRTAAARRGQLRASQAEREDVIDVLKAAYVAGRLTEDEFEARVGQAFAARTHADLASITADIPAEPAAAQPAGMPDRVVAWGTGAIIAAAALGGALLIGGSALILWAITMIGALLFTVSVLLSVRQKRRSRRRPPRRAWPRSAHRARPGRLRRARSLAAQPDRPYGPTPYDVPYCSADDPRAAGRRRSRRGRFVRGHGLRT